MNDSDLLQGLRHRDAAAMQWFCDCVLPSLWRYVYTRVHGDSHLAEDITNESVLTMLTVLQSSECVENDIQNPAGWLRTVAARRVADHYRAVARVQHLIDQVTRKQAGSDTMDPAQLHARQELRLQVRQAMDGLPDQHRLALEWKYLDKLSVREIAARWDTTEKAVESILFRARADFRERMAEPPPSPSCGEAMHPPASDANSEQSQLSAMYPRGE